MTDPTSSTVSTASPLAVAPPFLPAPLSWTEGMLLAPQHFQQNDVYWSRQMAHAALRSRPYAWGLIELNLSSSDLAGGRLRVDRLQAVLPDGLLLQYPQGAATSLQFDLTKLRLGDNGTVRIHLAVPARGSDGSGSASARRYRPVVGEEESDENDNEIANRTEVGRLLVNAELLPADQVPARYVSMPLVELRQRRGGTFELTTYHPPLLQLGAAAFLGQSSLISHCERLLALARRRCAQVAAEVDMGTLTRSDGLGVLMRHRRAALGLAAQSLPHAEVLLHAPEVHPFDLYVALAHFVGAAAGLGADPLPPLLPPYRHEDCAPAFTATLAYLRNRLDALELAFEWLPFEQVDDGHFRLQLPEDVAVDHLIAEFRPKPGSSERDLIAWLQQARVCSEQMLHVFEQRRQPGARLSRASPDQVPGAVTAGDRLLIGMANQSIEVGGRQVSAMQPHSPLVVHGVGGPHAPAFVALYRRVQRSQTRAA